MGSDETATATTGGPRVIAYLTGTGCHRDQIISFFCMQIGPRTPSGIGLGSGSRRDRMRPCSGLSGELWIQNFGGSWYMPNTRCPAHDTQSGVKCESKILVTRGHARWNYPLLRRRSRSLEGLQCLLRGHIHTYIYLYGFLVCRYARSPGLAARQNTPAIDRAFYRPNCTSYQLQPSFHTY